VRKILKKEKEEEKNKEKGKDFGVKLPWMTWWLL